jgi:hypothetical protein
MTPFLSREGDHAGMNNVNLGAKSGRIIVRARTISILNGGAVIRHSMSSIVRQARGAGKFQWVREIRFLWRRVRFPAVVPAT